MKLQIEVAETGWIVTRPKHPPKIFIHWAGLVAFLLATLTNQGEG